MDGPTLLRFGLTLALLLAVPGLLLWLVRRWGIRLPGQPQGGRRLAIVARTPIDAKHSLILIRRDSQEQLLMIGPGGPTVLEPAIRLTREDRAEQRRLAAEEQARIEAARAALAETQARMQQTSAALVRQATRAVAAVRSALAPSFARLVDRADRAPARAPQAERAKRTSAPGSRPRRARPASRRK